ncbi:MAG: ABC transporter permease, partial [Pseudomonadota bacterium]|nr:ABC transporter permease [Pseudomonadota bacterium]
ALMGQAILTEASLSFLGIGILQKPRTAWGLMLQGGTEYAESALWVPIFPGLAITLAVLRFNLFGAAMRDTLDPRLRSQ